jgi:hypothetical protein
MMHHLTSMGAFDGRMDAGAIGVGIGVFVTVLLLVVVVAAMIAATKGKGD